ncbi:hypothetical protein PISL3812_00516 [Talaromyces islandicus]|uniref:Uncharacterized protein n=1 Tax=Talaromyces islandicus TaxID=28573 RepID=A0A0U1LJH5_TALIS|nr:hypothetical protein PISL3812_00516 [Talaromyces islandicus]
MAHARAPVEAKQVAQQGSSSSNSNNNTALRWRASSFFQRNRSKETPNNASSGMQHNSSNMAEVVDVDDDTQNPNNNNTPPPPPSDDTPMSDAPGDEQASSESRASQTDGEEERGDEDDEASEGGDIQHTGNDDHHQPAAPASTTVGDDRNNDDNDSNGNPANGPLATTSGPPSSLPMQPGSSQHVILEANRTYYGKRLNFKEQVLLFEICNKYKSTFGERSKLCEWWRTVTDEFCREINGPYSWHSVRRKVEQVTKQRVKQRSDEESTARDQYPDDLCKVVDEFIPVWTKFEASEKRRIEVRDSRAASAKKRKLPPTTAVAVAAPMAHATPPGPVPWHASAQRWSPAANSPIPPPQFYTPPGVKMPAGYDTMFKPPHNGPQTPQSAAPAPYPPHHLIPPPPPPQPQPQSQTSPLPPPAPPQQRPLSGIEKAASGSGGFAESSVTSAVLETLSKLNKHLEQAAAAGGTDKSPSSSSPIVAALANAVSGAATKVSGHDNNPSEETRAEKSPAAGQLAGETNAAHSPSPSASSNINNTSTPATTTTTTTTAATATSLPLTASDLSKLKNELKQEMQRDFLVELQKIREAFSERLEAMEQTQEMIMDMLRQEPGRDN